MALLRSLPVTEKIEEIYKAFITESGVQFSELEEQVLHFHLSNLEYACGSSLRQVCGLAGPGRVSGCGVPAGDMCCCACFPVPGVGPDPGAAHVGACVRGPALGPEPGLPRVNRKYGFCSLQVQKP